MYLVGLGLEFSDIALGLCAHCHKRTIWAGDVLLWPNSVTAPLAHPDLPESIRVDYEEARQIAKHSPRGAAALLRLCVQKLCKELGEPGANINADIASMVQKGLPVQIQQSLDVLRVVGNNAVHPGSIDLNDDPSIAHALFGLINLVVENRITQPRMIEEMYASLPQQTIRAIEDRDKPKT